MKDWEKLEIDSTQYLTRNFGNNEISFKHLGMSDSTMSDIEVTKNNNVIFYIEVKSSSSQSGQFVLSPKDSKTFIYSEKNKTPNTQLKSKIIDFINSNFEKYLQAGTKGCRIDIDNNTVSECIKEYYSLKGVKYIITYDGDYIIVPLNKIEQYFSITANFRIKKSGSSKVPASEEKIVESLFNLETGVIETFREESRLMAKTDDRVERRVIKISDNDYYLSPKNNNEYEIRKLSKTKNMNVIFSLKLVKGQDKNDLIDFAKDLQNS